MAYIKESELKEILAEVAEDLAKAFKESEADLVKSADLQKDFPAEETPGEDHAGSPPEGSESSDVAASPAPEASEGAPEDASASPDQAPVADDSASMDPAADQSAALTPEALQAEYSKLSPEELDMHIQAALAAKEAVSGAPADAPAPQAPAPDMSASPAPASPDMAMGKEEMSPSPEREGKDSIDSIKKSEFEAVSKKQSEEIESLKALIKSQSEDIDNLAKIAKSIVEQPLRKAVTSVAHIANVEAPKKELTKETIHARLRELSAKPELKKSERQLINDFYDGRIKADKLAPLFEDYK